MNAPEALVVRDLVKTYPPNRRALDGVNLAIAPGEFVAVMGPSGSGKSTLLNCIATIDEPTRGEVLVAGASVAGLSAKRRAAFRRERLGFIFQDHDLLDTLTCYENIALALAIAHADAREIPSRVRAAAARLGVTDVLDKYPYQVSGGQAQRVACARAIVREPDLILADEPSGALDSGNARRLMESLVELNRAGSTILMVTHDPRTAAFTDRVVFIKDGRVSCEVAKRPGATARDFLDEVVAVSTAMGADELDEAQAEIDLDDAAAAFSHSTDLREGGSCAAPAHVPGPAHAAGSHTAGSHAAGARRSGDAPEAGARHAR